MSFTFDITKDILYQEGVEKGKQEMIFKMLKAGTLTTAQIAEFADVPEKQVKQLQKKLSKKGK